MSWLHLKPANLLVPSLVLFSSFEVIRFPVFSSCDAAEVRSHRWLKQFLLQVRAEAASGTELVHRCSCGRNASPTGLFSKGVATVLKRTAVHEHANGPCKTTLAGCWSTFTFTCGCGCGCGCALMLAVSCQPRLWLLLSVLCSFACSTKLCTFLVHSFCSTSSAAQRWTGQDDGVLSSEETFCGSYQHSCCRMPAAYVATMQHVEM